MKSTAEELSKTAAKTGSQAESAAEQAAASGQAQEVGTDTQKDPAEASGASAGSSGTSQGTAGSTDEGKAGPAPEQEQEPDQARGPGASAGAAGAPSFMERLRSMASTVQREVGASFPGCSMGHVNNMQAGSALPLTDIALRFNEALMFKSLQQLYCATRAPMQLHVMCDGTLL